MKREREKKANHLSRMLMSDRMMICSDEKKKKERIENQVEKGKKNNVHKTFALQ